MTACAERRRPAELGLPKELEEAGLDLVGVLSAAGHDVRVPPAWRSAALAPGARSALVLAASGRGLWHAFRRSPEARDRAPDPLDRFVRARVESAAGAITRDGWASVAHFPFEVRGGTFADYVALARACGLGAPSRLGLLIHPELGPWWSIRAVVLTTRVWSPDVPLAGSPCDDCPAPCAAACHGGAVPAGPGRGFDVAACARTRSSAASPCAHACDARRACVVGRDHAIDPEAEAFHHAAAADAMRDRDAGPLRADERPAR